MAWVIENQSQAGRLVFTSVQIPTTIGSYIEVKATAKTGNTAGYYRLVGNTAGFGYLLEVQPTRVLFRVDNNSLIFASNFTYPPIGVDFTIRLTWLAGGWNCQLDGQDLGTVFNDTSFIFDEFLDFAGRNSESFIGQLHYVEASVSGGGVDHYWDATSSDHGGSTNQPILTDTVGGNDAVGVGFPSFDASVWVDLGGGGTVYEESTSFAAESSVNNQTLITLSASISIDSSPGASISSNMTMQSGLSLTNSAEINTQNIANIFTNALLSSSSDIITSLGNLINESLALSSEASLSQVVSMSLSGAIALNSSSLIGESNNIDLNASANIGAASSMAVVSGAILSAGLDLSAISSVQVNGNILVIGVTTPDGRTTVIEVSSREFKITANDRVTKVMASDRITKI